MDGDEEMYLNRSAGDLPRREDSPMPEMEFEDDSEGVLHEDEMSHEEGIKAKEEKMEKLQQRLPYVSFRVLLVLRETGINFSASRSDECAGEVVLREWHIEKG